MNTKTQRNTQPLEGDKFYIPNWEAIRTEALKTYATEAAEDGIEFNPTTDANVHVWGVSGVDEQQMFFHSKAAWRALAFAKYSITFLVQLHGETLPVFVQIAKDEAFIANPLRKSTSN